MPANNCFFVCSTQEKENKMLSELLKYVCLLLIQNCSFFLNKKGLRNQKLKIILQCDFSTIIKNFLPNFSAYVQFHSDQSFIFIAIAKNKYINLPASVASLWRLLSRCCRPVRRLFSIIALFSSS